VSGQAPLFLQPKGTGILTNLQIFQRATDDLTFAYLLRSSSHFSLLLSPLSLSHNLIVVVVVVVVVAHQTSILAAALFDVYLIVYLFMNIHALYLFNRIIVHIPFPASTSQQYHDHRLHSPRR
jgi:hypothetical protein